MPDLALVSALLLAVPVEITGGPGIDIMLPATEISAPAETPAEAPPTDEPPSQPQLANAPIEPSDPPQRQEGGPEQDEELEIVISGRAGPPKGDPLENLNLASFEVTQAIDTAFVRPVAKTYQRILPHPVRDGIRNAINNLREPVAFINFLLQLKPGKAIETAGRFAINTTVGGAGLFDIARRRPFKLPRRPNGLANTFGYYGIKPGPFLFVPLVGPTTVRDFIGDGLDRLFLPLAIGKPFTKPAVSIAIYVASSLDQRAEFDEKLEEMHKDADPYARTREDYLRSRQAAIDELHGVSHIPSGEPAPKSDSVAPATLQSP